MSNENKTFYDELIEEYTEGAIVRENRIGSVILDYSVIDTATHEILAVFRLKEGKLEEFNQNQLSGFNSYMHKVHQEIGENIPVYYVFESNRPDVYILKKEKQEFKFINVEKPTYADLQKKQEIREVLLKQQPQKSRKKALRILNLISWACALVIAVILVLSKYLEIEITSIDVTLLIVVIILVVLPYVQKISYKDFDIVLKDTKKNKEGMKND